MSTASVQLGLWTDRSKSGFWGPTWTASASQGLLLVSFFALFIAAVSRHAWGIIRYSLHQIRSSGAPQDGLYHQQQLILRNSASPETALWRFLQLAWAWRGRPEARSIRAFPLLLTTLIQVFIFAVASIFSSEVLDVTDIVLVHSPYCGYQTYSAGPGPLRTTTDFGMLNAALVEHQEAIQASSSYARRCYSANAGEDCDSFVIPQIHTGFELNVECPFEPSMCLAGTQGAMAVDSGYIHTDTHLGINSGPEDSLAYRRVTTCSPLRTAGFSAWQSTKIDGSLPQFLDFSYGNYLAGPNGPVSAPTFTYDVKSANYSSNAFPVDYRFAALKRSKSTNFVPVQELHRDDADITLVFLQNNADFANPVEDIWYHATVPATDDSGFDSYVYRAVQPVTVMGCIEQHQLCDPSLPADVQCSALTGWSALRDSHIYSGPRASIAQALYNAISNSLLRDIFFGLGTDALLASESIHGASSLFTAPLPSNQWQLEVESWHAQAMAHIQRLVANVASGPIEDTSAAYVTPPVASSFNICISQKIRAPGYSSFSMIGLALVVGAGLSIIVANLTLPTLVKKICRLFGIGARAREDWDLDGLFQVQRLAYQEAKLGTWSSREGRIPTTLRALTPEMFRKPGREIPIYEQVELTENDLNEFPETVHDRDNDAEEEHYETHKEMSSTFYEYSFEPRRESIDIVPAYTSEDDEETEFVDPRPYGTRSGQGTTAARN